MPKRRGFLYEWMCDREHIREAIVYGAKGKHRRYDVKEVLDDLDGYIEKVREILVTQSFTPRTPRKKRTWDQCGQKWRTIEYVKFFPDGIIHTLMVMALQPSVMKGMDHWSCASIPGRGAKHAIKRMKRALHHDRKNTKYALKMDIHHFYHTVNRRALIWMLAKKVKDKKFLKLVWDILQTCEEGLGIGFFICQWLANFYLESLDRYITTLDGVEKNVRYMDDIVLMGPNKKKLHRARKDIAEFLRKNQKQTLKGNWQVFPVSSRPVDFVGYKFYRDHTTLRKSNFLRLTRQCRRVKKRMDVGKPIAYKQASGLLSRIGQLKHCNSFKVRTKYVDPIGVKNLKEVVRYESKRRFAAQQRLYAGGAA